MKKSLLVCTLVAISSLVCSISSFGQATDPTQPTQLTWKNDAKNEAWEDAENWTHNSTNQDSSWAPGEGATRITIFGTEQSKPVVSISDGYIGKQAYIDVIMATLNVNAPTTIKTLDVNVAGEMNVNAQLTTVSLANSGTINCKENVSCTRFQMSKDSTFSLGGKELTLKAIDGEGLPYIALYEASVDMNGGTVRLEGGSSSSLYFDLGDGTFTGKTGGYEVFTRVLMKGGVQSNLEEYLATTSGNVMAITTESFETNQVEGKLDATTNKLGDYRIYVDGNDLKVDYIADRIVPEPSTASLSLLALSALFIRRKRA